MRDELQDLSKGPLRLLVPTVRGRGEVCPVSAKATGSAWGTLKR